MIIRILRLHFLKNKSEAAAKLEVFMKLVENQFGRKVKVLRLDNGIEIKNRDTQRILENLAIFHSKSSAYTPQQNGHIEREMRNVVEAARSVIQARSLDENLWGEAVNYVIFIINQTGTSAVKEISPDELWFGRKMDVSKLKTFGCDCYVLIEDHQRSKAEKKSIKGIFVGYDIDSPGFRVYADNLRDILSSRNAIFDEKTGIEGFTELEMPSTDKSVQIVEVQEISD